MPKLPSKIIPIPNPDKTFFETWDKPPNRDMLDIIHPYRILICGKPHCGKSNTVLNILLRASKPFQRIIVCHYDAKNTKEYDILEKVILIDDIPNPKDSKFFDKKKKTLMIFDDMEFDFLKKEKKKYLDRIFGYKSTHGNLSLMVCAQNMTNIPAAVRRMSNYYIIFKVPDMDLLYLIGRKLGITKENFVKLMNDNIKNYHDSLHFDLTLGTPYPLRRNGYELLDLSKYLIGSTKKIRIMNQKNINK
jgi:hypothetical protein